jgi:small subunit ribosomal protein S7
MPRRREAEKREILPDPKFNNKLVAKFINNLMYSGRKGVAENIFYGSLDQISKKGQPEPINIFKAALENVKPSVEVKSRRVGGANYQVPVDVRPERRMALAIRWLITAARARHEKSMESRLAAELLEASQNTGAAVKKREDTHKMAEANKAFSHYRW